MKAKFKLLIIEDTPEKSEFVKARIEAAAGDVSPQIEIVGNLVDAIKRLERNYYDLVLLDILIPAMDASPRAEHSRTIIEQLASGRLVMPACVIGLTAYEEEYQAQSSYYSSNLFSVEHFNSQHDEWLNNIISRIKFISRWKASYGRSRNFDHDLDLVMVTSRYQNEFKPILEGIKWATGPDDDLLLYRNSKLKTGMVWVGTHLLKVGLFCIEEMGLPSASAVTSQLIDQFRPKLVVMLGMCCGFQQEQCQSKSKLGDIIVTRESACWDEGRYGELDDGGFFFNRAKPLIVSDRLDHLMSSLMESEMDLFKFAIKDSWNKRRAKTLRKKFKSDVREFPEVKYGLLLSGSSVIAHDVKGDELIKRFTNAIGLEMEVFGVFKAVDKAVGAKPEVFAVKGVADFGDGAKHKEFQGLASQLSLCVGMVLIEKYFDAVSDIR